MDNECVMHQFTDKQIAEIIRQELEALDIPYTTNQVASCFEPLSPNDFKTCGYEFMKTNINDIEVIYFECEVAATCKKCVYCIYNVSKVQSKEEIDRAINLYPFEDDKRFIFVEKDRFENVFGCFEDM